MTDNGVAIDNDDLPAPTDGFVASVFIAILDACPSHHWGLSRSLPWP
jgi:hypothetical protein